MILNIEKATILVV